MYFFLAHLKMSIPKCMNNKHEFSSSGKNILMSNSLKHTCSNVLNKIKIVYSCAQVHGNLNIFTSVHQLFSSSNTLAVDVTSESFSSSTRFCFFDAGSSKKERKKIV